MDIKHLRVLHPDCGLPYLFNEGHAARFLHLSQESRCIFVFTNCTITILFSSFSLYIRVVGLYIFKALLDSEEAALYKTNVIMIIIIIIIIIIISISIIIIIWK